MTPHLLDVDYVWSKSLNRKHQSYRVERRTATSLPSKPKNVTTFDERISQRAGELKLGIGLIQDEQYLVPCIKRQGKAGRIFRKMECYQSNFHFPALSIC